MSAALKLPEGLSFVDDAHYRESDDDGSGMMFFRPRYYDPRNGRFTRLDPFSGTMASPLTLHKYGYVHGNPISGIDPTGLFTTVQKIVGLGITAILAGIILTFNGGGSFFSGGKAVLDYYTAGTKFPVRTSIGVTSMDANQFMSTYHTNITSIAKAHKIPPLLLASVIYTEMRTYSLADLAVDGSFDHASYGGVQLQPDNLKNADYGYTLARGKNSEQIRVLLETPDDMITLVAQGMLVWNQRHAVGANPNVIQQYRNNPNNRAYWAGYMSSLKGTYNQPHGQIPGSFGYHTDWALQGEESWRMLMDLGYFNDD